MLASADQVPVICQAIRTYALRNIVVDPVMVATTGATLTQQETICAMQEQLFPLATLLTPNLVEAEALLGTAITTCSEMEQAASWRHAIIQLSCSRADISQKKPLTFYMIRKLDCMPFRANACTLPIPTEPAAPFPLPLPQNSQRDIPCRKVFVWQKTMLHNVSGQALYWDTETAPSATIVSFHHSKGD